MVTTGQPVPRSARSLDPRLTMRTEKVANEHIPPCAESDGHLECCWLRCWNQGATTMMITVVLKQPSTTPLLFSKHIASLQQMAIHQNGHKNLNCQSRSPARFPPLQPLQNKKRELQVASVFSEATGDAEQHFVQNHIPSSPV